MLDNTLVRGREALPNGLLLRPPNSHLGLLIKNPTDQNIIAQGSSQKITDDHLS